MGWVCLLGLEVSKLELLLLVCNVGLKNRQMAVWGSATGKTNQYGTEIVLDGASKDAQSPSFTLLLLLLLVKIFATFATTSAVF